MPIQHNPSHLNQENHMIPQNRRKHVIAIVVLGVIAALMATGTINVFG